MSKMKVLLVVGIVASVIGAAGAARPIPESWGEAVNGLQMSISQDDEAAGPNKAMHFIVEFRNVGDEDFNIRPGDIRRCGPIRGETDAITLSLVDSQGTPHRRLSFLGDGPPYFAGCFGEVVPLIVPLPPGASFSIPLGLGKYLDLSDSKYPQQRFRAGTYTLQAEMTGGPSEFRGTPAWTGSWTGTVTSNTLEVHFDADFGNCSANHLCN